MDIEKLIEKTLAELNLVVYAEFNANASIFDAAGRKILRAAFAEVRRDPEEKLRELREAVNRAVSALRDGIVRYELVRAMNAAELLPPAAEERGK